MSSGRTKDLLFSIISTYKLGIILFLILILCVGSILVVLINYFPESFDTTDKYLNIIRGVAILAFVSSTLLFVRIIDLGEIIRNLALWFFLASLLVIGYTFQNDFKRMTQRILSEIFPNHAISRANREVILTADSWGNFKVIGKINDTKVLFLIDTGATHIVLSPKHAERIGINLSKLNYNKRTWTANGIGMTASHHLKSISVGIIRFIDVEVSINRTEMPNSLLGMAFLKRLESFEVRGRTMYLRK